MRRPLAALGAASALIAGFLVSAPGAEAAITDASIIPSTWQVGSSPAAVVTLPTNAATTANPQLIIEWDWPTSLTAGTDTATLSGSTYTCTNSGIAFEASGSWSGGSVSCTYEKADASAAGVGKITLTGATSSANSIITVSLPAGTTTAAASTRGYGTWTAAPGTPSYRQFRVYTTTETVEANPVTYPPQPPTNVTAVKEYDANLDRDVIRVSWDAPADAGTLPVSHYAVYGGPEWGSPTNAVKNAGCLNDSTAKVFTSCVVSSQNAGYSPQLGPNVFFVKAFNGLGWSGAASSNMLDIQYDPTPASAPLNVKAVGGWNKVTVSWEKPTSKGGGGAITNYLAVSDPGRKVCITTVLTFDPNRKQDANPMQCEFTNLTPGAKYDFRAQALNGNGWGELSATSNSATPWNLKVTNYSRKKVLLGLNQELTVKGAAPGLPAGHKVGVEWRIGSGGWKGAGTVGAAASFTWTQKMPIKDRKATVAVRFFSLDPVTGERHDSNQVVVAPAR